MTRHSVHNLGRRAIFLELKDGSLQRLDPGALFIGAIAGVKLGRGGAHFTMKPVDRDPAKEDG